MHSDYVVRAARWQGSSYTKDTALFNDAEEQDSSKVSGIQQAQCPGIMSHDLKDKTRIYQLRFLQLIPFPL